jgi:hypothetical protein
MKKISIILFLIFNIFFIKNVQAIDKEIIETKFLSENISISQEKFEEGDKIKINTKIFNHNKHEFTGVIVFFDNNNFLGKKDFEIKKNNNNTNNTDTVIGIDWVASAGKHTFFARMEKVKFLKEEAYLIYHETDQKMYVVPKKKIIVKEIIEKDNLKNKSEDNSNDSTDRGVFEDIEHVTHDIGEFIKDKTPNFIKNPIIASSKKIENFRQDTGSMLKDKKNKIKKEIDDLDLDSSEKSDNPFYLKPFKYLESFFSTLSSAIFNNKILFYSSLTFIFSYLIRFIWRII